MNKKQRRWFWVLFAAGFILDYTGALGLVHEFFHWSFTWLSGGYARILTLTFTGMDQIRLVPLLAGPWGEMIVWLIISFALMYKGKLLAAGFFWGVFHGCWTGQPFGSDFLDILPRLVTYTAPFFVAWFVFAISMAIIGWVALRPYLFTRRSLQVVRSRA